jgi:maltose-binding protein MalE
MAKRARSDSESRPGQSTASRATVRMWGCGLLLGILLLPLLSGCSEPDDRIRIRIWHQKTGAEREFFNEMVARFNAANPDVVIDPLYRETEELRNLFVIASVGGQGPEIIFGPADNVGVLAVTQTIRSIDDVLDPSFLASFTEDGIVSWEGSRLLIADQLGNHLAFVYNKKFFDRAPETTDELVEELQRITTGRGRDAIYGLAWNYREPFFFIPFLTGFGGWVMDEHGNPSLDNQATVDAIRFVLDLRDRYRVIPGEADYDVAETLFMEGRAAAIINGPWALGGYERAGIDFGIAPIPRVSATGLWSAPMVAAKGYSVNVNVSDDLLPHVRDVLMYLTGEEMQREMAERISTIPTQRSVLESDVIQQNPLLVASMSAMEKGRAMPVAPQMRQIWDGMRGPYQLIMNGAVTPEEGARRMQRDAEKRIADTFL